MLFKSKLLRTKKHKLRIIAIATFMIALIYLIAMHLYNRLLSRQLTKTLTITQYCNNAKVNKL